MLNSNGNYSRDCVYNMIRVISKQKVGLKVVHLNAQSLRNKIDEFRYLFTSAGIDVVCVSETWFPLDIQDSAFELSGFRLFRSDRKIVLNGLEFIARGGGVAIYVRNGIPCREILKTRVGSDIEYLFIEISTLDRRRLLLGSVYRPSSDLNFSPLINILEDISVQYDDIVITGDFNNNLLVDNPLIEPMRTLDLYPVNILTPTHFHYTSNSLIDLIFVNHRSRVLLYDQLSASVFSRHDILFLTYDLSVQNDDTYISYRDLRNIDYTTLDHVFACIGWDRIFSLECVNDQLNFIQDNVKYLFDLCVPNRNIRIKPSQPPWFNAEIKSLIRKRDEAYSRWKRFKTLELKVIHNRARKKVTKRIKVAKSSFYHSKFSNAVDSKSKWREVRKIGIGRRNSSVCHDVDLNSLNRKFVNISVPSPTHNIYENLCYVEVNNPFSFRCVDQFEVLRSFSAVKSNAVGLDGLNPKFFRVLIPKLLPYVTHLFNNILTKSVFPDNWKLSKIIPIPKSNNEFRPIAILPFLSKVLENLISGQMNDYLTRVNLFSERQSGFMKGRSCTTALVDVVEDIRSKLDENMVSFLILLDHSKAFDTVDHSILLSKLHKQFYFSSSACNLISSYLANRSQLIHLNGDCSDTLNVNRGVPQGSILGPLLFCLYINDLPDIGVDSGICMYADDVQLYRGCNIGDINFCVTQINSDLSRINFWANANGLCINPLKSKYILLSKSKRVVGNVRIHIDGNNIDFVDSATNLGVTFNNRLTWTNHISVVVGRVYAMLRNLWAVIDSTPFSIRMLLAKAYLVPSLLYGCELFANCDSIDLRKLKVAYNNIARYIFRRGRHDHISTYSFQIFNVGFEDLLKYKCLTFLHKVIVSKNPSYIYNRIVFARSNRGRKIIVPKYKSLLSQRQFLIYTISLWNSLPNNLQNLGNATTFKKELFKHFNSLLQN